MAAAGRFESNDTLDHGKVNKQKEFGLTLGGKEAVYNVKHDTSARLETQILAFAFLYSAQQVRWLASLAMYELSESIH